MSVFPPGFAAFQNCFWAEYRFMGHSLKRQSTQTERERETSEGQVWVVCVKKSSLQSSEISSLINYCQIQKNPKPHHDFFVPIGRYQSVPRTGDAAPSLEDHNIFKIKNISDFLLSVSESE